MRKAQKNGILKVKHNNYLQKERRRAIIAQRIKIRTMWAKADWSHMSQTQALRDFRGYYPTSAIRKQPRLSVGLDYPPYGSDSWGLPCLSAQSETIPYGSALLLPQEWAWLKF